MKIMVIGHARHGKDSVCSILRSEFGLSFVSSSYFVARAAVVPWLAARNITYENFDLCYADRINRRAEWFNAIADYNKDDPARLGRELFAEYDIYCGIRNRVEYEALRAEKAFDFCFWVDASLRVEPEPITSNTMRETDADFIIDNNGDEVNLRAEVLSAYQLARVWTNKQ